MANVYLYPFTKSNLAKTVHTVFAMVLFLMWIGCPTVLQAQVNISGKAGLLYIPSAEVVEDGTFSAGYAYNPVNYAIKFNKRNSESIYFVNLVVLPRLEVNINLLRPNGSIPFKEGGIGDRQVDLKYVFMTEKGKRPSMALILSAPFGVDNSLITEAIVATKHMPVTRSITAAVTIGMGSPYSIGRRTNTNDILSDFKIYDKRDLPYYYLSGPFGGVKFDVAKKGGIMAEWDSQHLNVGAYALLFGHWTIQAGLLNGDQFTAGTSYSCPLLRLPKRFRKHE
ncbi:YjbH domain-containing protein [Spirosoma luteum]|uniref:YjbH domain-containing protein n=1 Tax=Spirosoma luteum TaxID=431553 RepID=UPI00036196AB|nr:YjbH domain-containing protein [Spirosoma luteum]